VDGPAYDHPVGLTCEDGLERSRLTVFFRLILVLPHLIWLVLWGVVLFFAAIGNWFATLFGGSSPPPLHGFIARYVRYETRVLAYASLTTEPFPRFGGSPGSYPIDVEIAPPRQQNRWKTGFRLILAIPALLVSGALSGAGGSRSNGGPQANVTVLWAGAVLGWFAALFTGRMPRQLRDANLYALRYGAQSAGYLLLLTERYPDARPAVPPVADPLGPHPIGVSLDDELRRSQVAVFFRILLAIPHFLWWALWALVALLTAVMSWFVTLFTGSTPDGLHRFLGAFVRYSTHLSAWFFLVADPYPGFTGKPGSYPFELRIDVPAPQNRWKTGFRVILAIPAFVMGSALGALMTAAAFLGWFASLFTGRMPRDLRDAGAYALRYSAQAYAYALLLTDRYPDATPGIAEGPPA
jgi:Domain of unknown function (DUF4389)